jgi:hypothetical protein
MSLSWDKIFSLLANKRLEQIFIDPGVTHEEFIDDLLYLREVFNDDYLSGKGEMPYVREWLSELFEPKELRGYSVRQVHQLRTMLEALQSIPGFDRLCRQLPSHEGFMLQLQTTYFVSHFLSVKCIESVIDHQDVDIVCVIDHDEVFMHVKSLVQRPKMNSQFTAWVHLSDIIDKMGIRNSKGDLLMVKDISGFVPEGLSQGFWREKLKHISISHEPDNYTLNVPNPQSGHTESVCFTTDWSSGRIMRGRTSGLDPFWTFQYEFPRVADKIPAGTSQKHFFVGITWFPEEFRIDRSRLEGKRVTGILVLGMPSTPHGALKVTRSEIFCKPSESNLEAKMTQALPNEVIM